MKRSLLLSLLLLICVGVKAQLPQYYVNGTNTLGWDAPFWDPNQKLQALYFPNNINTPTLAPSGVVTDIWIRSNYTQANVDFTNLLIKMGQTTATTFANGTYITAGMDTVLFAASYSIPSVSAGQWVKFALTKPFLYDNTKNLIVEFSQTNITSSSQPNQGFYTYNLNIATQRRIMGPNGSSSGVADNQSIPSMGFNVVYPCANRTNFTVSDVTPYSAILDWDYGYPNASGWMMKITKTPANPGPGNWQPYYNPPIQADTFPGLNLEPNTCYYVHLKTRCVQPGSQSDTAYEWTTDSFCTKQDCFQPTVNVDLNYVTSTTALVSWDPVPEVTQYEYAMSIDPNGPPATGGTITTYTALKLTGLKPSTYYFFYLRAYCKTTPTSEWKKVQIQTRNTLGVGEMEDADFSVEAYPNPARDIVKVRVNGAMSGAATLTVTDLTGKQVRTATVSSELTNIDVSSLPSGIYMIKYTDNQRSEVIKINKQ